MCPRKDLIDRCCVVCVRPVPGHELVRFTVDPQSTNLVNQSTLQIVHTVHESLCRRTSLQPEGFLQAKMNTIQFVDESPAGLNGTQGPFVMESPAMKRSSGDAGLDSESDSDTELRSGNDSITTSGGPRPGKKTKGRVKIKMEFIENKLRRYTTFSKRKTGIMKKVGQAVNLKM